MPSLCRGASEHGWRKDFYFSAPQGLPFDLMIAVLDKDYKPEEHKGALRSLPYYRKRFENRSKSATIVSSMGNRKEVKVLLARRGEDRIYLRNRP